MVKQQMPLDSTVTFVANGSVQFVKKRASPQQIMQWEAQGLARIQRVVETFLAAAWGEDILAAMEPFDVESWAAQQMDEGRNGENLTKLLLPFAEVLKIDPEVLKSDMVSVRHHVLNLVRSGKPCTTAWRLTMHRYRDRPLEALRVALPLILALTSGTGHVESNFLFQQLKGSHRHAGKSQVLLGHHIKIRVNGPPLAEFCAVRGTTYSASDLCRRAQRIYASLFGSKKYNPDLKKGSTSELWTYRNRGSKTGPKAGSKVSFLQKQRDQRRESAGSQELQEDEAEAMQAAVSAARATLGDEDKVDRARQGHPFQIQEPL